MDQGPGGALQKGQPLVGRTGFSTSNLVWTIIPINEELKGIKATQRAAKSVASS